MLKQNTSNYTELQNLYSGILKDILDILRCFLVIRKHAELTLYLHLKMFTSQNQYLKKLGSTSMKESHSVLVLVALGIRCHGIDFSNS